MLATAVHTSFWKALPRRSSGSSKRRRRPVEVLLELAPVEVVAGLSGIHALAVVETGEPTLELGTRVRAQAQGYEAGFGGVELQGPVGGFESRVE